MTVSSCHVNTAYNSFAHVFIHLIFIEHLLYVRHSSKHWGYIMNKMRQSLPPWVGNQTINKINKLHSALEGDKVVEKNKADCGEIVKFLGGQRKPH